MMRATNNHLISAKANLRRAQVKAASAAGRSHNRRPLRGLMTGDTSGLRLGWRLTCAVRKSKPRMRLAGAKTSLRFWIITMLLVLFGLSTLKLR